MEPSTRGEAGSARPKTGDPGPARGVADRLRGGATAAGPAGNSIDATLRGAGCRSTGHAVSALAARALAQEVARGALAMAQNELCTSSSDDEVLLPEYCPLLDAGAGLVETDSDSAGEGGERSRRHLEDRPCRPGYSDSMGEGGERHRRHVEDDAARRRRLRRNPVVALLQSRRRLADAWREHARATASASQLSDSRAAARSERRRRHVEDDAECRRRQRAGTRQTLAVLSGSSQADAAAAPGLPGRWVYVPGPASVLLERFISLRDAAACAVGTSGAACCCPPLVGSDRSEPLWVRNAEGAVECYPWALRPCARPDVGAVDELYCLEGRCLEASRFSTVAELSWVLTAPGRAVPRTLAEALAVLRVGVPRFGPPRAYTRYHLCPAALEGWWEPTEGGMEVEPYALALADCPAALTSPTTVPFGDVRAACALQSGRAAAFVLRAMALRPEPPVAAGGVCRVCFAAGKHCDAALTCLENEDFLFLIARFAGPVATLHLTGCNKALHAARAPAMAESVHHAMWRHLGAYGLDRVVLGKMADDVGPVLFAGSAFVEALLATPSSLARVSEPGAPHLRSFVGREDRPWDGDVDMYVTVRASRAQLAEWRAHLRGATHARSVRFMRRRVPRVVSELLRLGYARVRTADGARNEYENYGDGSDDADVSSDDDGRGRILHVATFRRPLAAYRASVLYGMAGVTTGSRECRFGYPSPRPGRPGWASSVGARGRAATSEARRWNTVDVVLVAQRDSDDDSVVSHVERSVFADFDLGCCRSYWGVRGSRGLYARVQALRQAHAGVDEAGLVQKALEMGITTREVGEACDGPEPGDRRAVLLQLMAAARGAGEVRLRGGAATAEGHRAFFSIFDARNTLARCTEVYPFRRVTLSSTRTVQNAERRYKYWLRGVKLFLRATAYEVSVFVAGRWPVPPGTTGLAPGGVNTDRGETDLGWWVTPGLESWSTAHVRAAVTDVEHAPYAALVAIDRGRELERELHAWKRFRVHLRAQAASPRCGSSGAHSPSPFPPSGVGGALSPVVWSRCPRLTPARARSRRAPRAPGALCPPLLLQGPGVCGEDECGCESPGGRCVREAWRVAPAGAGAAARDGVGQARFCRGACLLGRARRRRAV